MMRVPPTAFSDHAVERFQERWAPAETLTACRMVLHTLLPTAVFWCQNRGEANTIWQIASGALLVVDPVGVVTTVLPKDTRRRR